MENAGSPQHGSESNRALGEWSGDQGNPKTSRKCALKHILSPSRKRAQPIAYDSPFKLIITNLFYPSGKLFSA